MSDNPKKCPKPEELKQLIDGSLPRQEQEQCTTHLDFCACCQTKLEEIATQGSNISKVVEHLGEVEPMATSAYWPVLNTLNSEGSGSGNGSGGVAAVKTTQRVRGRALDFL